MLKVSRLSSSAYVELRNDETATGQAVAALFLACLGYALGFTTLKILVLGELPWALDSLLVGTLSQLLLSMLAALVWAFMLFIVGTKLFKGKAKFWQLARPLFFSATPGILFVLIAIPIYLVYATVFVGVFVWVILAGVLALKNSMEFDYNRTLLTYIVGFVIGIVVYGFLR